MRNNAIVFCDGACRGNPGPGGFAARIYYLDKPAQTIIGSEQATTNNRMEIRAAIEAIKSISSEITEIEINTDSEYLRKGITEWIHNWKRNGWRAANGRPVKNQDLWKKLDSLSKDKSLTWKWVPAHSGIAENEEVDQLAKQAIEG